MNDPLGHQCLERRLDLSIDTLKSMLDHNLEALSLQPEASFVITGLGSSEAHARYLTYLINKYTPASATFRAVADFFIQPYKTPRREMLIVFSQGLSFNAQIALKQSHLFNGSILFTSSTKEGLTQTNKVDRIKFLESTSHVIHFPLEDEFDIFFRVVGPLAGYLASILFINRQWPTKLPVLPKTFLTQNALTLDTPSKLAPYKDGCLIIANAELKEYGCNIIYKFVEGLRIAPPHFTDYLSFTHGHFEQLIHTPKPVIILQSIGPTEAQLVKKCQAMLASIGIEPWVIESLYRTPISIFDHEVAINHFLLKAIKSWEINLRKSPGKRREQPIYAISSI